MRNGVAGHNPRRLPPERACQELNLGPVSRRPTLGLLSDRALAWYAGHSLARHVEAYGSLLE